MSRNPLAPLFAYFEEGYETKAGTVIEDAGWYYAFMGQMIGPFETEADAKVDAKASATVEDTK